MVNLSNWRIVGDRVLLSWSDGSSFYVSRNVFDRLFGPIVSGDKSQIEKEFSLCNI